MVPGFDSQSAELVVQLTRIQLLGLVLATQHAPIWALAQSRKRFVLTESGLAVASVFTLLAVGPVARRWGIEGVAWLFAARSAVRVLAMLPGSRLRPQLTFRRSHVSELVRRVTPLLISSIYYKSEVLVDRFLASMAPAGALSLLNLAQVLQTAATGVLTNALLVPVAPRVGELARAREWPQLRALLKRTAALGLGSSLLALAGLAVLGLPMLRVLVGMGGITDDNVTQLWLLALALGGTLVGPAFTQVLNYGFYALDETRRLSILSAISYTVGLGLKVGGFYLAGVIGLALGTSAYFALSSMLVLITLTRMLRHDTNRPEPA